MTTLMRNDRDRRSGKPGMGHARKERVLLFGTRSADYIRASSQSGCIQRPNTWLHPNVSLNCPIFPLHRGRRPYMGAIGQRRNLSSASDRGGIRRSSSIGGWCAFMNCRGEDDIDAKRSRPSIGKTREGQRVEKTRAFVWDPISGLHQGQQPKRLHSKAEYMAAPERFAELSDFSLAPRAPSIHGPSRHFAASLNFFAFGIADIGTGCVGSE